MKISSKNINHWQVKIRRCQKFKWMFHFLSKNIICSRKISILRENFEIYPLKTTGIFFSMNGWEPCIKWKALILNVNNWLTPLSNRRVPFRSIVIGLLSHQVLLQTIGCLLLQGSSNVSPSEHHLLPTSSPDGSTEADSLIQEDTVMPGG